MLRIYLFQTLNGEIAAMMQLTSDKTNYLLIRSTSKLIEKIVMNTQDKRLLIIPTRWIDYDISIY